MTPQHSAGAGPLTAQDMCEILLPALRPDGRYDFSLQWLTDKLNARLAAAPTGQADDDRVQCRWSMNGREMAVPQDLARLEALRDKWRDTDFWLDKGAGMDSEDCADELDSELTLLRAQQVSGSTGAGKDGDAT